MDIKLTQLSKHTWLFPHNPNPTAVQSSVGVIASQKGSLLVDAGNSPHLARKIKFELVRCNLPPVTHIIYTHHHWDHVYGACTFDAEVTAHAICKEMLDAESKKPWSNEYLNMEIKNNPKLSVSYRARKKCINDWATFRIVIPEEVFENEKVIDFDGITIELEHVGGDHSADSIIVKVPQDEVMFIGDCYYPPPLHLRKPYSKPSVDVLRRLHNYAYNQYVEGHAKPFTQTKLRKLLPKKYR
jgi:glyoxylase-like metal-dependent hydrolase (beta-lactamase superfamily II)